MAGGASFICRFSAYCGAMMLLMLSSTAVFAATYQLPRDGSNVIGEVRYTSVGRGENLADISRRARVGMLELIEANPAVHPWRPKAGSKVVIPTAYILPPGKREGLVINLPELRLYYYHKDGRQVTTFPIAIGKQGWETPISNTRVIGKTKDPTWRVPRSILAEKKRKGIHDFPSEVPPGPKNPLGKYAIRLGVEGILLHGTNRKTGIGSRVSHGCMRMFADHIESLFHMIPVGTPVKIINEPYKVGWRRGEVYFEAHKPLSEYRDSVPSASSVINAFAQRVKGGTNVEWRKVNTHSKNKSGIPMPVGEFRSRGGFFFSAPEPEPRDFFIR